MKVNELASVASEPTEDLNAQIELTSDEWGELQKFESDFSTLDEASLHFIFDYLILFPERKEFFDIPLLKKRLTDSIASDEIDLAAATGQRWWDHRESLKKLPTTCSNLDIVVRLIGDHPSVCDPIKKHLKSTAGIVLPHNEDGDLDPSDYLKTLRAEQMRRTILPEDHQPIAPELLYWMREKEKTAFADLEPIDVLEYADTLLQFDPKLHRQLREHVLNHPKEYAMTLSRIRADMALNSPPFASMKRLANYKLLLAEKIEVGSTGMVGVAENKKLAKQQPLPARAA